MPVEGCGEDGKSACHATDLEIAINAQKLAILEYDPSGQKQAKNTETVENVFEGIETVAGILFEPLDWATTIDHCITGECSPWYALTLLPLIPSAIGKYGDDIAGFVKRFDSFDEFKKYMGGAGEGKQWHHIVEQAQAAKSGFTQQMINSTDNVLAIDKAVHQKISAIYNLNISGKGSARVRDWLAGQSFENQFEFGLDILRKFGVIP
jgi:hypothetical protein